MATLVEGSHDEPTLGRKISSDPLCKEASILPINCMIGSVSALGS